MRRLVARTRERLRSAGTSRPVLSVVVDATGAGGGRRPLEACLASVTAAGHADLEVLVVGARPEDSDPRVRVLGNASADLAVSEATGAYLAFLAPGETVEPDAWQTLVDLLEETGSDLAAGPVRSPEPRPWSGELFARRRLRLTAAACPLALVDLSLSHKVVRTEAWRRSGARLDAGPREVAVLRAWLAASAFDLVARPVGDVLATDADLPVGERVRFSADRAAQRSAALVEAAREAPDGWRELAATHLLPPLLVDAVGGGEAYLQALRSGAAPLLDGADWAQVPVAARLGAWSLLHGGLHEVALVQDLLADHPSGLPVSGGVVSETAGLPVPDSWRRLEAVDRRPRLRVDPWLRTSGGRLTVRGTAFSTYGESSPPRVRLTGPDGAELPLDVVRRDDPRAGEWADRAFEDRTDAGWEATTAAPATEHLPGPWRAEATLADLTVSAELRPVQPPGRDSATTVVEELSLSDGVLRLAGSTDRSRLRGRVSGPRGEAGELGCTVTTGRFEGRVPLVCSPFGEPVALPAGRYDLGLPDAVWDLALLADPPELLDGRLRVVPVEGRQGPAVAVQAPLGIDERGAFAQQRLRTAVYAAAAPVRPTTVLLETFRGRSTGDSPGAVARELLARDREQGLGLDLVWVVDDPSVPVPAGTRAVARRSREWHDLLGHARGYVANAGAPYWFTKAPGQHHLQTWHGTPLKKIGEDRGPGDFSTWRHRRRMAAQAAGWDAMVSPSPFCSEVFRSAFGFQGEMLEIGYPRNDVLVADPAPRRAAVRRRLGLADHERVVLYAPTWREYLGVRTSKPVYVDVDRLVAALPDAVLLVRGHYNSTGQQDLFAGRRRVRDVTRYPDVADLFLAADALITDYSSVMFDFALTDRPVVLLVPDLEQYRDVERGFYFDVETTSPGPLVATTDDVVDVLRGPDGHAAARRDFRERFCPWDDGRASARAVDHLLARW